jgi:hypothetical protein
MIARDLWAMEHGERERWSARTVDKLMRQCARLHYVEGGRRRRVLDAAPGVRRAIIADVIEDVMAGCTAPVEPDRQRPRWIEISLWELLEAVIEQLDACAATPPAGSLASSGPRP